MAGARIFDVYASAQEDGIGFMNGTIFREYDLRGDAAEDFPNDVVERLGQAYSTFLQGGPVVVGRDNRLSSPRIHAALVRGLSSADSRVIDIGEVSTPMFYFARTHLKIEGGLMITASHNAAPQNGLKICRGEHTMYGEQIQDFRRLVEAGQFLNGHGAVEQFDIWPAYREMMREKIKLTRPLKVVVDCGNAILGKFAPTILRDWGCEVVELYCEPDGRFPNHEPDPTKEKNMKALSERVVVEGADLGLGFDGDGDRIGAVDERGGLMAGDRLLVLFFRELLQKNPGALCLIEVKCSQGLVDDVLAHGGKTEWCRTGHSLIKAKMAERQALLAGEMSGHMFFKDEFTGADDALYAAGRLLRILSSTSQPFSAWLADAPRYFSTPEVRPFCPDERKFAVVAEIKERWRQEFGEIIEVDGVRVPFPDGWMLIRASNTGPALIVRAEGKTEAARDRYLGFIKEALVKFSEVVWEID